MTGIYDDSMTWQDGNVYVGLMTWFDSGTNSSERYEIPLHTAGHAHNGYVISLATLSHSGEYNKYYFANKKQYCFFKSYNH